LDAAGQRREGDGHELMRDGSEEKSRVMRNRLGQDLGLTCRCYDDTNSGLQDVRFLSVPPFPLAIANEVANEWARAAIPRAPLYPAVLAEDPFESRSIPGPRFRRRS
jgi:hypothetical protein